MELFERVKEIAALQGSVTKFASSLNLPQTTFNAYLNEKRQDNLWPILPRILEIYPQIRREWLYFNEGAMIGGSHTLPTPQLDIVELQAENARLRAELDEANRLNRKLTLRLLGEDGDGVK